ncbi:MAG: hypothetical protein DMF69_11720 [Acidobacteria bacterium]|nr:MAG: hypothetical protein DMF69_11720 [Acidobacteriota bacterium]
MTPGRSENSHLHPGQKVWGGSVPLDQVFVKYGLALLWVVGVAALLQTLLNVELALVALSAFYGLFLTMWLWSLLKGR